jgi:hypothetical protein
MERLLALFAQSTVKTHVTQHGRAGVNGLVEVLRITDTAW